MKKVALCVIGWLTGLTLCFSCSAQETSDTSADLEAVGMEPSNPAQTLIKHKSDAEITALYKKPCEQLYADMAILSATIQQKKVTDLTRASASEKHDLCVQIKQNATQELQRMMKSSTASQQDQQTEPEKKRGKILRRVFLGGAIKECIKP